MRFYDRKEELDKLQEINSLYERMARTMDAISTYSH